MALSVTKPSWSSSAEADEKGYDKYTKVKHKAINKMNHRLFKLTNILNPSLLSI
jgi:hypothetical protein